MTQAEFVKRYLEASPEVREQIAKILEELEQEETQGGNKA